MDRLPAELHTQIASHVASTADLKALALVSVRWAAATRPFLFATAHVLFWPESMLQRLRPLTRTAHTAQHVRALAIHIPAHPRCKHAAHFRDYVLWHQWLELQRVRPYLRGLPNGKGFESLRHRVPPYLFVPLAERRWGELYGQFEQEQRRWCEATRRMFDERAWANLLAPVPPVCAIVIDGADVWNGHAAPAWAVLENNQKAPRNEVEPNTFTTLLRAIGQSGTLGGLRDLTIRHAPWWTLCTEAAAWRPWLRGLERLDLTIASASLLDHRIAGYGAAHVRPEMLGVEVTCDMPTVLNPELQELRFHWVGAQPKQLLTNTVIELAQDKPCLRRLALGGVVMFWDQFREVLQACSATLEAVEFRHIVLKDSWHHPETHQHAADLFLYLVEHGDLREAVFAEGYAFNDTSYPMHAAIEQTLDVRAGDGPPTWGVQLARAVVARPGHRCGSEAPVPTREQRVAYIQSVFEP